MTRLFLVIGFLVAFGAGWMSAHTWRAEPHAGPTDPQHRSGPGGGRGSWLAQQLELTPEQQKQMDQIWSELGGRGRREDPAKRNELRKARDAAISALIRGEDRAAYDKVIADYNANIAAIETEWKKNFQQAVEKTREILTPAQRTKYEQLMSRWENGGRERGRPSSRPTTNP